MVANIFAQRSLPSLSSFLLFFFISAAFAAEPITLVFVGDIMLAGRAAQRMRQKGFSYPFAKVQEVFSKADIRFGNLEVSLTGRVVTQNRKLPGQGYIFKVPPYFGQALKEGGFQVVSVANNHALDGGRRGLKETLATLKALGIKAVGGGRNWQEAYALRILQRRGKSIGFLAFTDLSNKPGLATDTLPGIAYIRRREAFALQAIATARKKVDLLVVSVHWGREGHTLPNWRQKHLAHQFIDAGADIVVGHHPHRVQPIERYKGKVIAYSLGNFLFDNRSYAARKSVILRVSLCGNEIVEVTPLPALIVQTQPKVLQTALLQQAAPLLDCPSETLTALTEPRQGDSP